MENDIQKIINSDIDTILKDGDLSLLLLSVYSKLFLNGKQPSACEKCIRDMYRKIVKNGIKITENMKNKTCIMVSGMVHVQSMGKHFSDSNMTDELAIELLTKKILSERYFVKLPKGYKEVKEEVERIELSPENLGGFTSENLKLINGSLLMNFAKTLTDKKVKNKTDAIEVILNWQKAE